MNKPMRVIKRDGNEQEMHYDKIQHRLAKLSKGLTVDIAAVAGKVIGHIVSTIKTSEIDLQAISDAVSMKMRHPDYGVLAARIATSNLHKETPSQFSTVMFELNKDGKIDKRVMELVVQHGAVLDEWIVSARDYTLEVIAIKTLEASYLSRIKNVIVERPQHMYMRVALAIHGPNMENVREAYELMSKKVYTHATPTLFHAGKHIAQTASCFLLKMKDDSILGIYDTLRDTAQLAKYAGGIGIHAHEIRGTGAIIRGTDGVSNGILPMMQLFNTSCRYVDQGGGKRKGSIAFYLEVWHWDIEDFLNMSRVSTKDESRAHDLFTAMWLPDLFMQRLVDDGEWTLFCPHTAPGLNKCYGPEFELLYQSYVDTPSIRRKTMRARDLWNKIALTQIERGFPYLLYKDTCNFKNNQKHLGTLQGSNLCAEVLQYTSEDEIAVCNLGSINLRSFCHPGKPYDFEELMRVTKFLVRSLDNTIDISFYAVPEAKRSNERHRPIGVGVQGLADVFAIMMLPYESAGAHELNRAIFEHIYLAACEESCLLAQERGSHPSFPGSPASQGIFQFDMWGVTPTLTERWADIKARTIRFGRRNSQLTLVMPTVASAHVVGSTESVEPFPTMVVAEGAHAGTFSKFNPHLAKWLVENNMWTPDIIHRIIANQGSVQKITEIPAHVRAVFKTVWEIKQRAVIDMAAARGPYIDQSQSMNIHLEDPTPKSLMQLALYEWYKGVKSQYYLRTKPASEAAQVTVPQTTKESSTEANIKRARIACTKFECDSCSS